MLEITPVEPSVKSCLKEDDTDLTCPICKRKAKIDEYGTLVVCGHRYGGGANGRLHLFNSLEELMKFEE